jgi:hypothetical protein
MLLAKMEDCTRRRALACPVGRDIRVFIDLWDMAREWSVVLAKSE